MPVIKKNYLRLLVRVSRHKKCPCHTGLPFIGMLCLAEIDRKLSGFGLIEKLRPLLRLQLLILYAGPDFRGLLGTFCSKKSTIFKKSHIHQIFFEDGTFQHFRELFWKCLIFCSKTCPKCLKKIDRVGKIKSYNSKSDLIFTIRPMGDLSLI